MKLLIEEEFGRCARLLRLDTLIELRWLAVAGQAVAALAARFVFSIQFPLWSALSCIVAAMGLNVWLRWRFPVNFRLSEDFAAHLLGFDIFQLAILLFLTGGLANPFSLFFLAPLATSAVSLPWRRTLMLLSCVLVSATVLAFFGWPLKGHDGAVLAPSYPLNLGLWAALIVSSSFVAFYGARVADESRNFASALNASELILARAQHLTQLDGLAAAAAHELGTPLATVALVLHEMASDPKIRGACQEDLALAEEQVARCRKILGKLSSPADMAAHAMSETNLADLLEELVSPHRLQDIDITVRFDGPGEPPMVKRSPAALYGLANLIENAVGFATARVDVQAQWRGSEVEIIIADDGPGFPVHVLQQFGEPFISDRATARRSDGGPAGGLGLGLFIAKSLLERSGAKLEISNAKPPSRGAIARIGWSRQRREGDLRPPRQSFLFGELRQGAEHVQG